MTPNTTTFNVAAIASNGRYLLLKGGPHLHVLDIDTGAVIRRLDVRDPTSQSAPGIDTAALSPDGRLIAAGDGLKSTTLWDADTGARRGQLDGQPPPAGRGAFSPDGEYVLTRQDQTVRLWSCATGERVAAFQTPESVMYVAVSSGGLCIAATGGHFLALWNRQTGTEWQLPELGASDPDHRGSSNPCNLAIAANGEYALTADFNGIARQWDASTGAEVRRYDTGRRPGISPTRTYLRTPDGSTEHVGSFRVNSTHMSIALSADGRTVVTVHPDEMRVWDGETGQMVRRIECSLCKERVSDVALSPDSRTLVILEQGVARILDTLTGVLVPVPMPLPN